MVDINQEVIEGLKQISQVIGNQLVPNAVEFVQAQNETTKELLLLLINTVKEAKSGRIQLPEYGEANLTDLVKSIVKGDNLKQIEINDNDYEKVKECMENSDMVFASYELNNNSRAVFFKESDVPKMEDALQMYRDLIKRRSIDEIIVDAKRKADEFNKGLDEKTMSRDREI